MNKHYTSKAAIRAAAYNALAEMSLKERTQKSKVICDTFLSSNEYRCAQSIFIYLSAFTEADTRAIVADALKQNKAVYVPVLYEKMRPVRIDGNTKFTKGKYGIDEPEYFNSEENPVIDIAVIPLVAFDNQKNRLGRGKGYYDYFLRDFKGKKIALAFEAQCFEALSVEAHDIVMDKIITEKRVLG
ncbi:MAG: 5-formyltetrahydrofolate cyclo-ligase [Christensenellales bacterium]|jgi:5-formyltetrahydrofolate cyclo-ligase